jgi:hypothetical protein
VDAVASEGSSARVDAIVAALLAGRRLPMALDRRDRTAIGAASMLAASVYPAPLNPAFRARLRRLLEAGPAETPDGTRPTRTF